MNRYKTPLRYPGGKQRLAPFVLEVMEANDLVGGDYVEPYAGGAGVAMELLLSGQVKMVHLNDASLAIYAFWRSILEESESFCRRISTVPLTVDEWRKQRAVLTATGDVDLFDLGFSLFYLNRCNRSGIPTGGVIGGLAQNGAWKMDARFMRKALITRIEAIAHRRDSILVFNQDAESFIKGHLKRIPQKSLVYLDPPYFNKAERLYLNHYTPSDHARIAKVIQTKINIPWIVSYDSAPEILEHYSARQFFLYDLQYSASRAYRGREAFFFSDEIRIPDNSSILAIDQVLRRAIA